VRLLAALASLLAVLNAGEARAANPEQAPADVGQRIDEELSGAGNPDAAALAPPASLLPNDADTTQLPDASLVVPASRTRLRTPLDGAGIESRIDKGMTAAGQASSIPADYAFGAFQRGYFLTAFALALNRAKQGDTAAQTLLGELQSRGLGVKQDLPAAADWYRLAADHGDPEALYALGRFYLDGRGVKQDLAKAAELLEKAANAGQPVAAREFAYMLLQGKGRGRNALLAAAYLRKAARVGDMDAQYALGGLYVEGVGVVADDTQAARWYAAAARNGHVGAEIEYAIMLFNGRGVPKDEAVAARWFAEASRTDNPAAQLRYARLLAEGRGVDKNEEEAARWYLIAKQRGLRDDFLDDFLTRLSKSTLDEASAAADRWARYRQHEPRTAEAAPDDHPRVDKQVE
jgi:TPR repeat protein